MHKLKSLHGNCFFYILCPREKNRRNICLLHVCSTWLRGYSSAGWAPLLQLGCCGYWLDTWMSNCTSGPLFLRNGEEDPNMHA